ncbi:hypothetical protein V2J09_019650 [Rumex salicifolius]
MNCLQILPRTYALPVKPQFGKGHESKTCRFNVSIGLLKGTGFDNRRSTILKAVSSSKSGGKMEDTEVVKEEKSDEYSTTMTEAMGADLTYRHELGMNYSFIRPDLIVGSCLQVPEDVDKLQSIGVKTVFCLQQDPDLEYFSVDIKAIQEYAKTYDDIEHIRAEIRDFDKHDLRLRLPAVVGELYKAISRNGGVTYIHCTAGIGRAPAVALSSIIVCILFGFTADLLWVFHDLQLAYMYWVQGYKLSDAHKLVLSKRSCCPNLEAIKNATADILTGLKKKSITLQWAGKNCSSVEISGLDIGWGEKLPLNLNKEKGVWILERELPEGQYEYKYIIDGEWLCNEDEPLTTVNQDGHINNYVQVLADDLESDNAKLRLRLTGVDPDLREDERNTIKEYLEKI